MKVFRIIVGLTTLAVMAFTGWWVAGALATILSGGESARGWAQLALFVVGLPLALLTIAGVYATRSVWRGGRPLWVAGWLALVGLVAAVQLGNLGSVVTWLTAGEPISIGIVQGALELSYPGRELGPGAGPISHDPLYPQTLAFLVSGLGLMVIAVASAIMPRRPVVPGGPGEPGAGQRARLARGARP
jgi:hypothetical protein